MSIEAIAGASSVQRNEAVGFRAGVVDSGVIDTITVGEHVRLALDFKSVVRSFIKSGITCKDARLLAAYRITSFRKCLMPHEFFGLRDLAVQFSQVESDCPIECNDKADVELSHGRVVRNSTAAQSTIDHEEIRRQWEAQGDVLPLYGVDPTQSAVENSIATADAEEKERRYIFELGHDLQSMPDDDIIRLWPSDSVYMLGIKYKHPRQHLT